MKRAVLEDILPAARAHGLRVHAWMHAMRCNVPAVMRDQPLDTVMPMIYHRGYDQPLAWIETAARVGVTALGGRDALQRGRQALPASAPELSARLSTRLSARSERPIRAVLEARGRALRAFVPGRRPRCLRATQYID
ncbi:MAG: hypothetical protein H0T76_21920 [Nannocystis sp.]|nr:hypothetical protein [Nannocystis sp.]MBA3549138.1 hypothetical protein [Nannocystis sp.]